MERVVDPLAKKPSVLRTQSETIGFVIMVAALAIAPFVTYPLFLMQAMCFALFACAFNLLIGYVGLLSFGHALYFGWASYLSAYSAKAWGFPPELAILTGTVTAAICGLVAGSLAIRRQGIYFAMITLALAQMMYFFALQAKFTGGEDGIQAVPRGHLFGIFDLRNEMTMYAVVLVIFLAGFLFIYRIIHSPFGEVLKAIRENETRAISLGYKTDRYKLVAFVLSATLAGVAGATKAIVLATGFLDRCELADVGRGCVDDTCRRARHDFWAGGGRLRDSGDAVQACADRGVGARHPGRDFRGLRASVSPRHHRRDSPTSCVSASSFQPPLCNRPRIVVHGDLTLYAVVFVQISVVVDAFASFGCRLSRVPGGTQWRLCRAESASIRLPRNGTRSRSGGLPTFASLSAAAGGSIFIPKSNSALICAKPSALRRSGPSWRRPDLPRRLAEISMLPAT